MRRRTLLLMLTLVILAGCQSAPEAPILPTATPQPTAVQPTPTETFLPPPTVTPFPTGSGTDQPSDGTPAGEGETAAPAEGGGEGAATAPPASTAPPADTPTPIPTVPPPPTSTPVPTMQVPDGVTLGLLIYEDPLDRGWPSSREGTAKTYHSDGRYVFEIGPFDAIHYSTGVVDDEDYYAQVEVTPANCPEGGGYGLMFHYEGAGDQYIFTVFCDGRFTVMNRLLGSLTGQALASGTLPAGLDAESSTAHVVAVKAESDTYSVYFDYQELATFVDTGHPQGDVAMYAASQHNEVLRVAFDNLGIWELR